MSVQIECGVLRSVAGEISYRGPIALSDLLNGELSLRKLQRKTTSDNAPAFDVFYKPKDGDSVRPVGQAWLKNSDKVEGGDFLSLTLDDPKWEAIKQPPVNLSAFPRDDGTFRLVWQRLRQDRLAPKTKAA